MPHSPARWPPYGLPETSRLLKVDHYTLHLRIKMRSCGWAASSQKADYTGVGVGRSYEPRSDRGSLVVQTLMCIEAGLSRCLLG
jgi:hypothetical protein